jgi:hypothetical protein
MTICILSTLFQVTFEFISVIGWVLSSQRTSCYSGHFHDGACELHMFLSMKTAYVQKHQRHANLNAAGMVRIMLNAQKNILFF